MNYRINYSERSRMDLRGIYEYIAYELLSPETAVRQTGRIMKAVRALEEMPFMYRLYEEEPWHSKGLRLFSVDNYLILYLPDEKAKVVNIVRIMYGGRNIDRQLIIDN